jgi:hypothetical protein
MIVFALVQMRECVVIMDNIICRPSNMTLGTGKNPLWSNYNSFEISFLPFPCRKYHGIYLNQDVSLYTHSCIETNLYGLSMFNDGLISTNPECAPCHTQLHTEAF